MKRNHQNKDARISRQVGVFVFFVLLVGALTPTLVLGQGLVGEGPRLGPINQRFTQDQFNDNPNLKTVREAGIKIFTTPFNPFDGYGDGPLNLADTTSPGGRPSLQGNGRTLRINGLDAQTCQECHSVLSNATIPATTGVGASGSTATSAMFQPKDIDPDDEAANGFAFYDGRFIDPPHTYGVGGVQLLGKEMTADLQALKQIAIANPNVPVALVTKGVDFGIIVVSQTGNVNTSRIVGVDPDLVVKPFGRKGEFATVRQFDQSALMFHLGMQPVEIVGKGVDADGDGVVNEILVGELSALEVFLTTQNIPSVDQRSDQAEVGAQLFEDLGCSHCHRPELWTNGKTLGYSFPEINEDPFANEFYEVDLSQPPSSFRRKGSRLKVRLFSDLKRHDMGPGLAESFQGATLTQNSEFITAKLWGVADTAPYLHDGRAQTLGEAINHHGGEALDARNNFAYRNLEDQDAILRFLRTLRTPRSPNKDVFKNAPKRPEGPIDEG
jgi:hypothetical protein